MDDAAFWREIAERYERAFGQALRGVAAAEAAVAFAGRFRTALFGAA